MDERWTRYEVLEGSLLYSNRIHHLYKRKRAGGTASSRT